jgi:hypothetical protein
MLDVGTQLLIYISFLFNDYESVTTFASLLLSLLRLHVRLSRSRFVGSYGWLHCHDLHRGHANPA